jgi:hypothetical protein
MQVEGGDGGKVGGDPIPVEGEDCAKSQGRKECGSLREQYHGGPSNATGRLERKEAGITSGRACACIRSVSLPEILQNS